MKKMALADFGILFSESRHARAIIDRLIYEGFPPAEAIELRLERQDSNHWKTLLQRLRLLAPVRNLWLRCRHWFTPGGRRFQANILTTPCGTMLRRAGVPRRILRVGSVNEREVQKGIDTSPITTWFAVTVGIFRKEILSTGNTFINCHKGYLPNVKGLSATHWAILTGAPYGATAHLIDEGLDTGPIIVRRQYPIPRVRNLLEVSLEEAFMIGDIAYRAARKLGQDWDTQPNEGGRYYHAIHPVLAEVSYALQLESRSGGEEH